MTIKTLIAVLLSALVALTLGHSPAHLNNQAPKPERVTEAKTLEVEPVGAAEAAAPEPQPPVVHPIGCENYRNMVAQYDWNVDVALSVIRAESGCNPSDVGDGHLTYYQDGVKYGMSCGLFQIRFLPGRPTCSEMQQPGDNVAYAYRLYESNGWKPWSVCNKRIVRCY